VCVCVYVFARMCVYVHVCARARVCLSRCACVRVRLCMSCDFVRDRFPIVGTIQ